MAEPWEAWTERWEWLRGCLRAKGCRDFEIKVSPPLPQEHIAEFERETGLRLPRGFAQTVTQFARAVSIEWELRIERERDAWLRPPGDIGSRSGGTGAVPMWIFAESVVEQHRAFQEEMAGQVNDYQPEDYDSAAHRGYFPIFRLGDGGAVVLDLARDPAPILHLNHGSPMPEDTAQIGVDFTSFMTRWSNIGCLEPSIFKLRGLYPDSEDPLRSFYDPRTQQIDDRGPAARAWISWLEG